MLMQILYREWRYTCLPSAIFLILLLGSSYSSLGLVVFLVWLQLPIYLIHEFEEHVYPGWFKKFINEVLFKSPVENVPLNDASVFWINIPFIWIMFPLFAVLSQHVNLNFGLILPYFAVFNATTHIIAAIAKRRYNPGLLVSIFLNYPSGIITIYYLSKQAHSTAWDHGGAFIVAFVGHLAMLSWAVIRYKKYQKNTLQNCSP